jgi:hypothetical protein
VVDGKSPYTFVLLHFLVPRVHNPFDGRLIPDGGVDISCEQSSPVNPSKYIQYKKECNVYSVLTCGY